MPCLATSSCKADGHTHAHACRSSPGIYSAVICRWIFAAAAVDFWQQQRQPQPQQQPPAAVRDAATGRSWSIGPFRASPLSIGVDGPPVLTTFSAVAAAGGGGRLPRAGGPLLKPALSGQFWEEGEGELEPPLEQQLQEQSTLRWMGKRWLILNVDAAACLLLFAVFMTSPGALSAALLACAVAWSLVATWLRGARGSAAATATAPHSVEREDDGKASADDGEDAGGQPAATAVGNGQRPTQEAEEQPWEASSSGRHRRGWGCCWPCASGVVGAAVGLSALQVFLLACTFVEYLMQVGCGALGTGRRRWANGVCTYLGFEPMRWAVALLAMRA